eukprot:6957824-Ditylum_brightwellii.AAC.1
MDTNSNKETKIKTKKMTCKKTMGHPETIIAMPVVPGLKKDSTMSPRYKHPKFANEPQILEEVPGRV